MEKSPAQSLEYDESIINTVREPLIVLDQDLRVISASRSFYKVFKVNAGETVGQLIYDLGNKQWDIPKLRELLGTILPEKTTFDDYEVEHVFTTLGRRTMLLNARQIERAWGKERIILLAIEDISERKRLEDLLAESEEQYRRLFETASDGIVLLEKNEGHIAHANPAVEEILGYSEAECLGKNMDDIGVSIYTDDFPATMRDLQRNGILNYQDVPVKTKSGQDIYTDIYMVDRAKLAQLNMRDVTEHKKAGDRLNAEKNKAQEYLDVAGVMIVALDSGGRITLINKNGLAILGDVEHEVIGQNWFDLYIPADVSEKVRAVFRQLMAGDTEMMEYFENPIITKTGEERILAFHNALLRNAAGEAEGILFSGEDITVRKQAETDLQAALVKSHETATKLEAIMASMGDGLSIQNTDYIITYQNQALKDLIGDHVGEPCYTACEHKDRVCEGCPVEMVFSDGAIHHEARAVTIGKKSIYREVTASPLRDMAGNIVAVIEVIRDVTEQKQLEAQLRHAQKMEAIGTLAGGIAHDFNNILNVIMGYGNMVLDTLAAGSPAKEDMHTVLLAADKAANLTRRLLIFSRKEVVVVQPLNINELILDLRKMLDRMVRESIELHLELADMPLIVAGDAGLLEQVLMNLATNASDAMPEGGRFSIGTSLKEMDDEFVAMHGYGKPGRYALITVADTGRGMDAETQKRLFEPFFTTKDVGEGTGLGLAISYGIIQQHDGYIKVYSEPGQGTVFNIYLPLDAEATSPNRETASVVPVKGGNETVLVAEDDAAVRELSRRLLESFGYTVITAGDGEEAIAAFMENRERISLAMLDMIMPRKNGKEVAAAIKKINPRIKVLFASGYTMDLITSQKITAADFDFIRKPYQSKELLVKVREVLDK